jgi:hypothetical protein
MGGGGAGMPLWGRRSASGCGLGHRRARRSAQVSWPSNLAGQGGVPAHTPQASTQAARPAWKRHAEGRLRRSAHMWASAVRFSLK